MNMTDLAVNEIDRLGMLLAEIADLTAQADAIKDRLKDQATAGGATVYEGLMFKSSVVSANRSTVDWKAIAAEANIPADLIAAHTKINAVFTVKTTSR